MIKLVFESLCRALIRFFDNRSIRNNDVEWYRMELDKRSAETQLLYARITDLALPVTKTAEVEDNQNFEPVTRNQYKSWPAKRRELEQASYNQALKNAEEARTNIARSKTTEQLEAELLNGTD